MFKAAEVKQRNKQVAALEADKDARIAYAKTHATAVPIIAELKHNLKGNNTFALSDTELKFGVRNEANCTVKNGKQRTQSNAVAYHSCLRACDGINNAALGYNSVMEGEYKDWQYIVSTNLLGYMAMAHEAIERMKVHGQGHILNVGSMSADVREKDSSVYVATKAGIQGFSEALRKEVNPLGIKVTLIEPGAVGTDMQPQTPDEQRKLQEKMEMLKSEDIAASLLYALTQPRRCDVVVIQIRPHLQSI